MDDCLERNDIDGFQRLFGEYLERISYGKEVKISNYDLIFANLIIPEDAEDKNNKWNVIDYEWSFEKDIDIKEIAFRAPTALPVSCPPHTPDAAAGCYPPLSAPDSTGYIDIKEIAFRAVYCYLLENEKRNKLNLDLVMKKLDVTHPLPVSS